MRYIGYIEIAVGFGNGLGPGLGAQVYPYLGYEYTMYVFGVLCFVGVVFGIALIPSELNQTATEEEIAELEMLQEEIDEEMEENEKPKKKLKIGWYEILSQP